MLEDNLSQPARKLQLRRRFNVQEDTESVHVATSARGLETAR